MRPQEAPPSLRPEGRKSSPVPGHRPDGPLKLLPQVGQVGRGHGRIERLSDRAIWRLEVFIFTSFLHHNFYIALNISEITQ
jgi:hypothetical protein